MAEKKKKWIPRNLKRGALTATAKRLGMTLTELINRPPAGISTTTKRRIALAKTFRKYAAVWSRRRKERRARA